MNKIEKKIKYREFCSTSNISVFGMDWWMDSVCGKDNWDVAIVIDNDEIVASLPFFIQKKFGFKLITMPVFSMISGLYINYPLLTSEDKRISFENKVLTSLIEQLPDVSSYLQSFNYTYSNHLSFYWKGYNLSSRYTYVIENLDDIDLVFNNFDRSKKKNIRKSGEIVNVEFDLSAKEFYENHKFTLSKQNKVISYDFNTFEKIYNSAYANNSGKTIYAIDSSGNIHAALFVVWDEYSAYNLISTIDPDFRKSGANSLLVFEIIKYVSSKTKTFNFAGSMIESVEKSIRKFGGIQKQYYELYKYNSIVYPIVKGIKDILF